MSIPSLSTLVISGSIRSRREDADKIFQIVSEVPSLEEYIRFIKAYQQSGTVISNTDIISGAALLGMRLYGAEVNFYPLARLFKNVDRKLKALACSPVGGTHRLDIDSNIEVDPDQLNSLKQLIGNSDGLMLSTPVYFGDRSSVANKLIQLNFADGLLDGKVFGTAAVGAKRNGGQETAIVFSLFEALNQNAIIVGNGPPSSQYGGTAVAGNMGTAIDDMFGLQTTFGTGARIAEISNLIRLGRQNDSKEIIKILILVTMDNKDHMLLKFVENLVSMAKNDCKYVEFSIVNVLNSTIYRCIACSICPVDDPVPLNQTASTENHAHCIIKNVNDNMEEMQHMMLQSDGIIIAGLNVQDQGKLTYRYQALIERTRYMRRDHFELSNRVVAALSLNEVGARVNNIHSIKTLTSYIRHNVIMHRSIEAFVHHGSILDAGLADLKDFVEKVHVITAGKRKAKRVASEYVASGFGGY